MGAWYVSPRMMDVRNGSLADIELAALLRLLPIKLQT